MSKKPILVLFDASPITNNVKTGVGSYTESLIASLAKKYPNEIILVGYWFNFLGRKNFSSQYFVSHPIKIFPGRLLAIMRRTGIQPPVELLVRRKFSFQLFTNFVSLPSIRKTPQGVIIYDLSFIDHPEYTQEKNLKFLRKFVPGSIKRASSVITISNFVAKTITNAFPYTQKPIFTHIPPSEIGNQTILSKKLDSMGVKKNGYLLYLGTVEPRKNITNLLLAYELLPENIREKYALVIAGGKGWKDEEILKLIDRQKNNGLNVIQTGYITSAERAALYRNARAFTLPSHYEGFGMPVLEALECNIPTAVSDIEVFHEIAEDAVIYFDKDNPVSISKELSRLLIDDQLRKKLIARGKEQLTKYNWDKNAEIVFNEIKRVVDKRRDDVS